MACVVWIEGVDFFDTLLDTQKLSVIRGASRALESMPPVAEAHLRAAFPKPGQVLSIAAGASQAGFVVDADEAAAEASVKALFSSSLQKQGFEPDDVKPVAELDAATKPREPRDYAPFAHLKFLWAVEPVGADMRLALERSRARVRVAQMRDPGVRRAFTPIPSANGGFEPCLYDRVRPAEAIVQGPSDDPNKDSEDHFVSKASGARWHFGRALRQRLYDKARVDPITGNELPPGETAFCDDFQELVAGDLPTPSPQAGIDLPVACRRKMAVFVADGDKFGRLREDLVAGFGAEAGLALMARLVSDRMNALIETLARELFALAKPGNSWSAAAAATQVKLTKAQRKLGIQRLHRFETLLFGGEDVTFVAPCWLAWWLAIRFFQIANSWKIEPVDLDHVGGLCGATLDPGARDAQGKPLLGRPLLFSAGMVICSVKTPIRAAHDLAGALCHEIAKGVGGLEIEALESVEAPFDGPDGLRDRLLGKGWRMADGNDGELRSALTIPRDAVEKTYRALHALWVGEPSFPASQAHAALRAARDAGEVAAEQAGQAELDAYLAGAGNSAGFVGMTSSDFDVIQHVEACERTGLHLHFTMQQRDYVIAAGPWTDELLKLSGRAP